MKKLNLLLAALLAQLCAVAQITVTYNGDNATVNIPSHITDVTAQVDGAYVTLNSTTTASEYTYTLSGSTGNGGLVINGAYKLTLQLADVSITSQRGAAIDVECGKRIAVVLKNGSTNTLADCAGGLQKAALYFKGHPEFSGTGTLNVTGNTRHAVSAKEYLQIKKTFGTLNILSAVGDGINCGKEEVAEWDEYMLLNENEFFVCGGGVVNISNVGGDGIDSGAYGCMHIKGGSINITVDAYDCHALKACNTFIMEDGKLNILLPAAASDGVYVNNQARFLGGEIFIDAKGNGSKGVKGKLKEGSPYTTGGNLTFSGTKIDIVARGGDDTTDPEDISHCAGVTTDGNLTHNSGVSVTAVGGVNGVVCAGTMTGSPAVKNVRWYASPYDFQYDMTAYVTLQLDGKSIATTDAEVAAFANGDCRGTGDIIDGSANVYTMRLYSNAASGETLSFKAWYGGQELMLTPSQAVSFTSQGVAGSLAEPIVLTASAVLVGDVNGDGTVNTSDAIGIVNHVIGKPQPVFIEAAADVNGDGTINTSDAIAVVNKVIGK